MRYIIFHSTITHQWRIRDLLKKLNRFNGWPETPFGKEGAQARCDELNRLTGESP